MFDLILKASCVGCGSTSDLYGSTCKHMTLCLSCGKTAAEKHLPCSDCGTLVSRLIREYPVRPSSNSDKHYSIGRFVTGLPPFSDKQNLQSRWSLQKEGLQGRQATDALREKYTNKPWILEDDTGQFQYYGHLEGSQSTTYYLLMLEGNEFFAIPASSWYNFNKVAQYKQLTLEEAEEKMKNRRKTADGYQRWMMKAANNGPAAFGETDKFNDKEGGGTGNNGVGRGRKNAGVDDEEGHISDRGEEDEDDDISSKNKPGLNKKGGDDEEEGPRGGDFDLDDDDVEKGDDWEHEEIFTDDDEAVANDPEEREDLAPELPAPPEINQDEDDEDEDSEEEGGLSKSGRELKKLLGRSSGLNESDIDDDDDDDDIEDDVGIYSTFASKQLDAPKEDPSDNSPAKGSTNGISRSTPSSKIIKGKRKLNGDDVVKSNGIPLKKAKPENEQKLSVKDEPAPLKTDMSSKTTQSLSATVPVSEEEIRAALKQMVPMTVQKLVSSFRTRLRTPEDKKSFEIILKRISKIRKTGGPSYIVLNK